MAKVVITSRYVSLNGTDISSSLAGASLEINVEEVDTTSLGSAGWKEVAAGIKSGSVTLNYQQDFGAAAVDATLFPLLGTQGTVVIRPNGTVASATNPSYTATVLISQYTPISGAVGDLQTFDVTFPTSGAITRATA